jgi:protoheme IX farnesyltransferase
LTIEKKTDLCIQISTQVLAEKTYPPSKEVNVASRLSDYIKLAKPRLASLVVFSAVISYMYAASEINLTKALLLAIGGFLVTGASNAINQIIEKDTDKLMSRTQNRPLPQERITVSEAWLVAIIMAIFGIYILYQYLNPLCAYYGLGALLIYTGVYTPLKKISSLAVFIGAFPGAMPPMLGWVAESGKFGLEPGLLFAIQFIWQFPHFWAIAWVLDEDYQKAGFRLLPSASGRSKASAYQILFYSIGLIPVGIMPYIFGMSGLISAIIITLCGILFSWQAFKLLISCNVKDASRLMFASFIYLPVVQIALLLDKL